MTVGDEARFYGGVGERVARATSGGGLLLRRWFGAWIDFIALVVLLFGPAFLVNWTETAPPPLLAILSLMGFGLVLLYFPVTEGLWGRSLGKLVSGTIVVDDKGQPPGIGKATVRTIARLVEVNPLLLGGIPAGIVSLNTRAHQRIGDMWAGTYVVPVGELRRAQSMPDADLEKTAEHFT
jgi:uncharacterized RDD family membrane protein YckC